MTRHYTPAEVAKMTGRNIEVIRRKLRDKRIVAKKVDKDWQIGEVEVYKIVKKIKKI
jgi:hypothetical protein